MITPSWLSGSWRSFLYSSSVYSCHLTLMSSASVRFIPFLSFTVPIYAWNVHLVSLIFLKRSPVFPILLFYSISLRWSLRKAFLSLLAILWNSAFKWIYLPFRPLLLASLYIFNYEFFRAKILILAKKILNIQRTELAFPEWLLFSFPGLWMNSI